jgi:hypothetical protein
MFPTWSLAWFASSTARTYSSRSPGSTHIQEERPQSTQHHQEDRSHDSNHHDETDQANPATPPGPQTRVMEVTPEIAGRWLDRNTHNRAVSDRHVETLARDIAADAWEMTGEAIKWKGDPDDPSSNPELLDGQHRLFAVLWAEKPIHTLVVTGLERQAQDVMDTNRRRSAKNMLELEGYEDAALLAATASMAMVWEQGAYTQADYRGPKTPTHTEVKLWIASHYDALVEAAEISQAAPIKGVGRAVRCFVAYSLLKASPRQAIEEFFQSVGEMKGLEGKGDPRMALINRLRFAAENKQQIPRWVQANMLFRVWNALQRREQILKLQVTTSGPGAGNSSRSRSTWVAPEAPVPYVDGALDAEEFADVDDLPK